MRRWVVVSADAARARIFTLVPSPTPEFEGGPTLCEQASLVEPEARAHERDVVSDARGGGGREPGRSWGRAIGMDPRVDGRIAERRRRFAQFVADRLRALLGDIPHDVEVVVAAEAKMLGALRPELGALARGGVRIVERAEDLSHLGAAQLQEHLASEGVVPRRRPPQRLASGG